MVDIPTITVDLNKKCAECGNGGAVGNGLCMSCNTKAIKGKPMKTNLGRAVQQRWKQQIPRTPANG